MTLGNLQDRVAFWQKHLGPLGISHWVITVKVEDEVPGKEHAIAGVQPSRHYDTAEMVFRSDVLDQDLLEVDRHIVHELVHVALRDLHECVTEPPGEHTYAQWAAYEVRLDHEMEGVVDRIARTFVTLYADEPT